MRASDRSLTPAEHRVMEVLRGGPALLGAETGEVAVRRRRGPVGWYGASNAGVVTVVEEVRLVESSAARRLAKAGLILIEHGEARLPGDVGADG